MKLYIHVVDGLAQSWGLTDFNVRAALSEQNISTPENPSVFSELDLSEFGYFEFYTSPFPSHNSLTENVTESSPEIIDGKWTQKWNITSKPQQEVDSYIASRKVQIWDDIKAYRDHLVQTGGYKVGSHWYHSDTFSRTQQIALVLIGANMPSGIMWKTLDNGYVPMTQALAGQIFAAAAAQDAALFAKAADHKSALDLSIDPDSYDWRVGWTETYQGV